MFRSNPLFSQKMPVFQMSGIVSTYMSRKNLGEKRVPQILDVYSAGVAV